MCMACAILTSLCWDGSKCYLISHSYEHCHVHVCRLWMANFQFFWNLTWIWSWISLLVDIWVLPCDFLLQVFSGTWWSGYDRGCAENNWPTQCYQGRRCSCEYSSKYFMHLWTLLLCPWPHSVGSINLSDEPRLWPRAFLGIFSCWFYQSHSAKYSLQNCWYLSFIYWSWRCWF